MEYFEEVDGVYASARTRRLFCYQALFVVSGDRLWWTATLTRSDVQAVKINGSAEAKGPVERMEETVRSRIHAAIDADAWSTNSTTRDAIQGRRFRSRGRGEGR